MPTLSGVAIAVGTLTGPRASAAMAPTTMGVILICGGLDASGNPLATAELYNPATGISVATGAMSASRYGHSDHVAPGRPGLDRRGSERGWSLPGVRRVLLCFEGDVRCGADRASARAKHAAVILSNGLLLVSGGATASNAAITLDELYVPATSAETVGVGAF